MKEIPDTSELSKDEQNGEVNDSSNSKRDDEDSEWLDIIGSGSLKKKVIEAGQNDSRPVKGDSVTIRATGKLKEDSTPVDVLDNFIFTVGDGEVIHGLDLVVALMDKGEVAEVFMESRFAYGERGLEPGIPGGASLYYTVNLVDIQLENDPEVLPLERRFEIGVRKRERGNWWFKRDENQQAILCYKSAIDYLDDTTDTFGEDTPLEVRKILDERLKTLNNMAAAQMKVEAYDVALKSLDAILKCQPDNLKALFRKGKILGLQGEAKVGLEVLTEALAIAPDSRVVQGEVARLRDKVRREAEQERSLYRRMLGLGPGSAPSRPGKKQDGADRYPILKGVPLKLWSSLFVVLLSALLAFKHRDAIFALL